MNNSEKHSMLVTKGTRVTSIQFGEGIVIEIDKDLGSSHPIKVKFDSGGLSYLLKQICHIGLPIKTSIQILNHYRK